MKCELCPRMCGVDRTKKTGFCGAGEKILAAKAMLHYWEEPCLSEAGGSGAVFFSGCVMRCAYCQNYEISAENKGREISSECLAEIFLELQAKGAQNIDLVNPTHFVPQILRAIETAKKSGLTLPIVYNSGGYERTETLRMLEGAVDIYLPDVKYFGDDLAQKHSAAPNYFNTAMEAVKEMIRQTGKPSFAENGAMKKGVIVRHLVLPGHYKDSIKVVKRVSESFGKEILFSLMSQYTPLGEVKTDPKLKSMNRRITTFEYHKVLDAVINAGLNGFMQEKSSAKEEYTPIFDFEGL